MREHSILTPWIAIFLAGCVFAAWGSWEKHKERKRREQKSGDGSQ